MSKEIQIFENEQFGEIRTAKINNKDYFVGKDIALALGYKNTNDAISRHCKGVVKHDGFKINGIEVALIPEGDIYRLVCNSKLPSAEKFESWVFDEVLPMIRKTGGYLETDNNMTDEEIMAKALMVAQNTINKKNELLKAKEKELIEVKEDLNTKNKFINQIAVSENSLLVREVAKIASKNGVVIGEKRLWNKLRSWGFIFKNSTEAKQEGIERGYFEIVEGSKTNKDKTFIYKTTRVTGKGQIYIINRLLNEVI